jgi:hypothetical protein
MPVGMEKGGQLLFLCAQPTPLTTHEYDRIGFENGEQALFPVPAEANPNHDFQVLAARHHKGLKASFRECCGDRRCRKRKLAWHDLRDPEHNSSTQATGPLACSVQRGLSTKPGGKDNVDLELRAEPVAVWRPRGCRLLAHCE